MLLLNSSNHSTIFGILFQISDGLVDGDDVIIGGIISVGKTVTYMNRSREHGLQPSAEAA